MTQANIVSGERSDCQTLPDNITGPGVFYLWLPSAWSIEKLHGYLRDGQWHYQVTDENRCFLVSLDGGELGGLCDGISGLLTATEFQAARALFKPGTGELSVSDFPKVRTLGQLAALSQAGWLLNMLSEQRLTTFFQPIVWTNEPTKVYAQECLLRGIENDGSLLYPAYIFGVARASQLMFQTDLAARGMAICEAARHNVKSNLFINFTPTSIYDPAYCLRSTVRVIREVGIPRENIVFEVTETDQTYGIDHLRDIVNYYREFGFRIALHDVGSGYSSLNLIHHLRPDFIKLDMHLIRRVDHDLYKATIARKILEIAQELDIRTVAEGIETTEEMNWVRDYGATFAQGYLIAKPSTLPLIEPVYSRQTRPMPDKGIL
jgi:EAL domain-containing protein (putative c-di-GMP-specific phosphodiesterase class I)